MGHFDGPGGGGVSRLQPGYEFASREDLDREITVRPLPDIVGDGLGAGINRVQRLGE